MTVVNVLNFNYVIINHVITTLNTLLQKMYKLNIKQIHICNIRKRVNNTNINFEKFFSNKNITFNIRINIKIKSIFNVYSVCERNNLISCKIHIYEYTYLK